MPCYDYFCKECSNEKPDVILAVSQLETTEIICDVCQAPMVRRVGNAGGFRLKGGGWAEDYYSDYLGDINPRRAKEGKPELDYNNIHGTDFE